MAPTETEIVQGIGSDYAAKYGFSNPDEAENYFFKSGRGISHEVVEAIAEHKNEPAWMRKVRHQALDYFLARPIFLGVAHHVAFPSIGVGHNEAGALACAGAGHCGLGCRHDGQHVVPVHILAREPVAQGSERQVVHGY